MKKFLMLALLVLIPASMAIAADGFKLIDAKQLAAEMKTQKTGLYIYDANTDKTRKSDGIIPGAKTLAATDYDAKIVLPPDSEKSTASLVFYCVNTKCMASHEAAANAVKAGFKNVAVMSQGIEGWKKAGQPTATWKAN